LVAIATSFTGVPKIPKSVVAITPEIGLIEIIGRHQEDGTALGERRFSGLSDRGVVIVQPRRGGQAISPHHLEGHRAAVPRPASR